MTEEENLDWQKESLGRFLWHHRGLWMSDDQKLALIAQDPRYAKIFPEVVGKQASPIVPHTNLAPCEHIGPGTGCRTRKCAKGHGGTVGVKACRDCGPQCPDYAPDNATESLDVVIDQGASGIGDALQGLLAVGALKAKNKELNISYRVSPHARPFVALFDGYDELDLHVRGHSEMPVSGARQMNLGYVAECMQGIVRPRWERYASNIGTTGYILPELREAARIKSLGSEYAGFVLLCPFSTERTREYSTQHWLSLVNLLHNAGYKVAIVHNDPSRIQPFRGLTMIGGATAEMVAGAMLNAVCVIGTDSGLAHLGGILRCPTIVLGGSTPAGQIFGCYPRVKILQGKLDCSGCCNNYPADERCRMSCGNLQSIQPKEILEEVDRIWLSEKLTVGRTLVDHKRLAKIRDCILQTNHLRGDIAELGTYRGGVAKMMGYYAPACRLHIFDTFTGIPSDDPYVNGHRVGDFATDFEDVKAYVNNPNAAYHVGFFPATIPKDEIQYRFVHLDGDLRQTTVDALRYFWPRMVEGGVIVLDDLDWVRTQGVREALNEVLPGIHVERSCEYQGILRKSKSVSLPIL
jgi:hypothetical protein